MSVKIKEVVRHSPAHRAGIRAGDYLKSLGGVEIKDVLDYMFYAAESRVEVEYVREGRTYLKTIIKGEYDDLGLEFDSFLMDSKQSCSNKCIFCFIDQMPPNMRETLYFKDDDARLSFLQGNYITMTNLSDEDIDRIIKMRLNINISVHTTNPELRCMMMHNRFAGEKLQYLKKLADNGIMMNCQIVLCPGINDGKELERTLDDLSALMPSIQSIAAVPVGLTKFREGLYPLEIYNKETAAAQIDIIERRQAEFMEKFGTRLVFASDEFYITAERDFPPAECYEDYPQYENGVGMRRCLIDDFTAAMEDSDVILTAPRKVSLITGVLASKTNAMIMRKAEEKWENLSVNLCTIINHFFGETITVTGLITGQDLVEQLRGKDLGDELLMPDVMLQSGTDILLDDMTVPMIEKELGIKIRVFGREGYELLDAVLGV